MAGENHIELWRLTGNFAGNRQAGMGERDDEVRLLAVAQLFDEFAQALDASRIHASEFRRRLTSAGTDIGHADDGYFHALPLERY